MSFFANVVVDHPPWMSFVLLDALAGSCRHPFAQVSRSRIERRHSEMMKEGKILLNEVVMCLPIYVDKSKRGGRQNTINPTSPLPITAAVLVLFNVQAKKMRKRRSGFINAVIKQVYNLYFWLSFVMHCIVPRN